MNNIITLEGRVGTVPTPRPVEGKDFTVYSFVLGVVRKSADGRKEATDKNGKTIWDNILVQGTKNFNVGQGNLVRVVGSLRTESWQDPKTNEWKNKVYVAPKDVMQVDAFDTKLFDAVSEASGSAI
jgi:single-stranded DNA-binding protein